MSIKETLLFPVDRSYAVIAGIGRYSINRWGQPKALDNIVEAEHEAIINEIEGKIVDYSLPWNGDSEAAQMKAAAEQAALPELQALKRCVEDHGCTTQQEIDAIGLDEPPVPLIPQHLHSVDKPPTQK